MRWLHQRGLLIGPALDYGCGHGRDPDTFGMWGVDPVWRPRISEASGAPAPDAFQTVTCIYVLNVVEPSVEGRPVERARSLLTPSGRAYFAVRRDVPREGSRTGQRWVVPDGLKEFSRSSSFAVYLAVASCE